jgi:hypothetical protein
MTSFGIEWDTQILLFIPDIGKLPDKTVIYKNDALNLLISAEDWTMFKNTTPPPDACLQTIEIILGVFYSNDKDNFNLSSFEENCTNFVHFWNKVNAEGRTLDITLPNNSKKKAHLLTYMPFKRTRDDGPNYYYYRDCARKKQNENWTITKGDKEQKWVYIDDIALVRGNPQITIGFALEKYYKMVEFITDIDKTNSKTLSKLKSYLVDLKKELDDLEKELEKDLDFATCSDNCKGLILIIINLIEGIRDHWGASEEERSGTYAKAQFLLKLRTNPYYIYKYMLSEQEKEQFLLWFTTYYNNNKDDIIIKELYKRWINPSSGQIIINMKDKFPNSNLPSMGIFTMDNLTERLLRRRGVQVGNIKYLPNFWNGDNKEDMTRKDIGLAPQIALMSGDKPEDIELKYTDSSNNELLNFDYGEWYSNVHENIVVELRGFHLWYKLFTQQEDDGRKLSLPYKELCSHIYNVMHLLNIGLNYEGQFKDYKDKSIDFTTYFTP